MFPIAGATWLIGIAATADGTFWLSEARDEHSSALHAALAVRCEHQRSGRSFTIHG
jgi:hypothetical protein